MLNGNCFRCPKCGAHRSSRSQNVRTGQVLCVKCAFPATDDVDCIRRVTLGLPSGELRVEHVRARSNPEAFGKLDVPRLIRAGFVRSAVSTPLWN